MSKGVSIIYGDVAPEAKENFESAASESNFGEMYKSQFRKYNMGVMAYANPCEEWQTILDGSGIPLPDDIDTANIGLWSNQLSKENGEFEEPIVLTLTSEGQYSSQGFTFTFEKFNNIFPTRLTIQWYRETTEGIVDLSGGAIEFNPTSGFYFCEKKIENFNKVVIKFYALNMPHNRLKVEVIDYGYGTIFHGDELRNVQVSQSMDPIATEISINTVDFTLDAKSDMEYSLQNKQPLVVCYNDVQLASVFVNTARRIGRRLWEVSAEDYIGLMDKTPFPGDIYNNVAADEILRNIFETAKVPYKIPQGLNTVQLSGHIPYTTCREALMQVCFASGVAVNTSVPNDGRVHIQILEEGVKQTIPLKRIMQGQNFETESAVTGVELTVHTYSPLDDYVELYKAETSGVGDNILVVFNEPMHDLEVLNGTFVKDEQGNDKKGTNYAYINAPKYCSLVGKKYDHTTQVKRKDDPLRLAGEQENISSITNGTLVSADNAERVLDRVYNWLTHTDKVNLKIVEGKDVVAEKHSAEYGTAKFGESRYAEEYTTEVITDQPRVGIGEMLEVETEYLGNLTGRLISQQYNLNGGIIIKEAVIK